MTTLGKDGSKVSVKVSRECSIRLSKHKSVLVGGGGGGGGGGGEGRGGGFEVVQEASVH